MSKLPAFVKTGEPARLIPVVADTNREQRTASVILAAMRGVYEFRQAMLRSLGIRVGKRATLHAWTEVTLVNEKKKKGKTSSDDRPDGLLMLDTGKKKWMAMIEAKVGNSEVGQQQLENYIKQAKQNKIDAVITITNQFVALPSHHPVKIPKKLTRGINLYHWAWTYLLTQASLLLESNEIESEDQRFLLEEVVRHLRHPASGISRFDSMNREWKEVLGKVKSNATLSKTSEEVENTVSAWHQEQRDLCLVLSRKLGRTVRLRLSKTHRTDPQKRLKDDIEDLVTNKALTCSFEIPDAAADLNVTADLATRTIVSSMRLDAPQDRKSTTARVNWLRRQLKGVSPDGMYVKAIRSGRAEDTQAKLEDVLADPDVLTTDSTDVVPKTFEIFYMVDLAGRFSGSKVFIDELEKAVPHFYEQAGQRLREWVPPPPKIKKEKSTTKSTEADIDEGQEAQKSIESDV